MQKQTLPLYLLTFGITLALEIQSNTNAFAELSPLKLKGIHALFSKDCLNPIDGFRALKTGTLANIRFTGNYGSLKHPYGCQAQINIHQQKWDCPQDWTTAAIQQFFPSPDGVNFLANQGAKSDPLRKLPMEVLGRLWRIIHKYSLTLAVNPSIEEAPESWTLEVFRAFFVQEARQEELSIERKQHQNLASDLILVLKKKPNWKRIEPIANILFHALHETHAKDSIYPRNTVEQILLAYVWKRAGSREDLLAFSQENPECVSKENSSWILSEVSQIPSSLARTRETWLKQSYEPRQYLDWKTRLKDEKITHDQLQQLLNDPELLAFYANAVEAIDNPLPQLAGSSEAAHKSLGLNKEHPRKYNLYSECGETSVRNFFNILLFNRETHSFDASKLRKTAQRHNLNLYSRQGKRNKKGLLGFYEGHKEFIPGTHVIETSYRNSDPHSVDDDQVKDDWSRRVVSALPGGKYRRGGGQCELDAGVSNILNIIETLLGDPKWHEYRSMSQQWDRICQLFSTEDPEFQLDWTVLNGTKDDLKQNDTGVTLEFSINGKSAFNWKFGGDHFSIERTEVSKGWLNYAAHELSKFYLKYNLGNLESERTLPWFSSDETIDALHSASPLPSLLWSLPLKNLEGRLEAIGFILRNQLSPYYSIMRHWAKSFPAEDENPKRRLNAFYADYDYPLGNDAEHPGIVPRTLNYSVVKNETLKKLFGAEVANRLSTTVRDPRGLYWGSTLIDFQNKATLNHKNEPLRIDWPTAMEECLGLNEIWVPEIKKDLQSIRKLTDPTEAYKEYENLDLRIRAQIEKTKKGCFLPSKAAWKTLRSDLRIEGDIFIPQYLGGLYDRIFWSSTGTGHSDSEKAYQFFGTNGSISKVYRSDKKAVRCTCVHH